MSDAAASPRLNTSLKVVETDEAEVNARPVPPDVAGQSKRVATMVPTTAASMRETVLGSSSMVSNE